MSGLYCILPSGNASEFPRLDRELKRRQITSWYATLPAGGRLYKIAHEDIHKLPHDEHCSYVGDAKNGHSVYPMRDPEAYVKELSGTCRWVRV